MDVEAIADLGAVVLRADLARFGRWDEQSGVRGNVPVTGNHAMCTPEFCADPHPAYAQLREEVPVQRLRNPNGLESGWSPGTTKHARRSPTADLIEDYAYPLSLTVIAELLGAPSIDHGRFRAWIVAAMHPPFARDDAKEPGYRPKVVMSRQLADC